jgi:hypothetical protein
LNILRQDYIRRTDEFTRVGEIIINKEKEKIFPLLCPKMEEHWIRNGVVK